MPIDQPPPAPPAHLVRAATAAEPAIARALRRAGFHAVPLRASSVGHFHLSGSIDGRPVEILLDTGASNTVVDRTWAKSVGYAPTAVPGTAGGIGAAGLDLATIDGAALMLGDVGLGKAPLLTIDLGAVQAQLKASNVAVPQVVLGADTLRRHRAIIDYATATLWIVPTAAPR